MMVGKANKLFFGLTGLGRMDCTDLQLLVRTTAVASNGQLAAGSDFLDEISIYDDAGV
jgi:hypothetical protein